MQICQSFVQDPRSHGLFEGSFSLFRVSDVGMPYMLFFMIICNMDSQFVRYGCLLSLLQFAVNKYKIFET